MGFWNKLLGWGVATTPPPSPAPAPAQPQNPVYKVSHLTSDPPARFARHDGSKFPGGFGPTELLLTDYWTLRARSSQLFESNLYARGIIRRMVTNEINTGLHLEAIPEESLLGLPEDSLSEWSEETESRFLLWGSNPKLCDHTERLTFGELQGTARMEALISGDVLVVMLQDKTTNLPRIQLINGAKIRTPLGIRLDGRLKNGNRILHGVEVDKDGRHVAFHIQRTDPQRIGQPKFERLPAFGPRTGRRLAWLVYGTDKRMDEVRGKPLLTLVLQSLNEIDKYRDSAQRKALINSFLAMFIKKTEDKMSSLPLTGGAVLRGTDTATDSQGTERSFNIAEFIPGLVMEELEQGEEPVGFQPQGTDEKFGDFEEAIIQAVAWANEIPPEILRLSFSSNYAASQAAINEFKMYLNRMRQTFGVQFCQPIYVDWLVSQVLAQRIEAAGLLEAWRDPKAYETFGAWMVSDWQGQIKPAVDLSKLTKGYKVMIDEGLISRDRASRELTGTKYSKNVKKLKRENEALAEANEPLVTLSQPPAPEDEGDNDEGDIEDINKEDDDDEGKAA